MRIRGDLRSLVQAWRRVYYYAGNFMRYAVPDEAARLGRSIRFSILSSEKKRQAHERVDYYLRLPDGCRQGADSVSVREFRYPFGKKKKFATYFFDLYRAIRVFPPYYRFSYLFGDVNWECNQPTLVKSRPICSEGERSMNVLCRLNSVRHFRFITDKRSWEDKKDMLVFRNVVRCQPHRVAFLSATIGSEFCDVGQINSDTDHPEFIKPYMPMEDMLQYKFIACIEGNDVATNLKWVMSSNSVAVMPRPKIESWFMEATLIPGVHYIEIKEDYSDVEEKIKYYISHPEEAKAIVRNANEYVRRFRDNTLEQYVMDCVLKRYFEKTGQKG